MVRRRCGRVVQGLRGTLWREVRVRCDDGRKVSAIRMLSIPGWCGVWCSPGSTYTYGDTETIFHTAWGASAWALRHTEPIVKPPEGAHVIAWGGRRGVVVSRYVRHPAPDVVWVAWDDVEPHPDNAEPVNVRALRQVQA